MVVTGGRDQAVSGHPITPDGRYFVVRGRLWRRANPNLPTAEKDALVGAPMDARRAIAAANRSKNVTERTAARAEVDRVKRALGERGPAWWNDRAPDCNRHIARNTPYAQWFAD